MAAAANVNADDGRGVVDRRVGLMGGAVGMGVEACTEEAEFGLDTPPDLGRWNRPRLSSW